MRQTSYTQWLPRMVRSASSASVFLAGAILFSCSFLVGGTLLYARGVDAPGNLSRSHPFTPDPINFTFETSRSFFGIKDNALQDPSVTVVFTSTPDKGTPALLYRMNVEYSAGDANLCGAIHATSTSLQYDGKFQALDIFPLDGTDPRWEFNFSLESGVALNDGAECIITVHLLGWDQTKTMFLKKHRVENFIELTFKVDDGGGIVEVLKSFFEGDTSTSTNDEGNEDLLEEEIDEMEKTEDTSNSEDVVSEEASTTTPEVESQEATTTESAALPDLSGEDEFLGESQTDAEPSVADEGQEPVIE